MANEVIRASTEATVLVPEIWSRQWYDTLLAELPYAATLDVSYEGEISALGDTVKISTAPEFDDADVLPEDGAAVADAVTFTQLSLVIDKRIVKDFIVTNQAQLQSLPFVDKLKEMAIYAINKRIQSLLLTATIPSATAPDHAIAYDSGTTLALADILEAKELLDEQSVPMANRWMCVGSEQLNDIFNITGFTSSDYITAGSPLQSGQIVTPLVGFVPRFSPLFGDVAYFYHKSFMTTATQKSLSIKEYDLGGDGIRASRINVDLLMGYKLLDNKRVVTIG